MRQEASFRMNRNSSFWVQRVARPQSSALKLGTARVWPLLSHLVSLSGQHLWDLRCQALVPILRALLFSRISRLELRLISCSDLVLTWNPMQCQMGQTMAQEAKKVSESKVSRGQRHRYIFSSHPPSGIRFENPEGPSQQVKAVKHVE